MKRKIFIILFFLCLFLQKGFSIDSTQVVNDSLLHNTIQETNQEIIADSIRTNKKAWRPNPKISVLLSIIPGGGQIYNRKYWKAPIVWAGCAGLIYAIIYTNKKYDEYLGAYLSISDNNETTNSWEKYIPSGNDKTTVDKTWLTDALNQKQLEFRRYRDLSIIGTVLFYGLSFIDAFVDAQLYTFDISEDLSLRIDPQIENNFKTHTSSFGVRCQLNF